ncbi:hypothetical protein [Polycladospora coralii]|uniref:hypothetical protein n=1 Tax=Polycladospora coralii TaxID=2771432 RepID=UPI0020C09114|nr:hypothetical protein [Polycladospora coralii]
MSIYFYKIHDDFGCFSHFSPHGFELDGQYWKTREHYFQCQKYAGESDDRCTSWTNTKRLPYRLNLKHIKKLEKYYSLLVKK